MHSRFGRVKSGDTHGLVAFERIVLSSNVSSIAVIATEPGSVPCQVTTDLYDNRNPAWMPEL